MRCLEGRWEPRRISWRWPLGFLGATETPTKGECMIHTKGTAEMKECLKNLTKKEWAIKTAQSRKHKANSYQCQLGKFFLTISSSSTTHLSPNNWKMRKPKLAGEGKNWWETKKISERCLWVFHLQQALTKWEISVKINMEIWLLYGVRQSSFKIGIRIGVLNWLVGLVIA